VNGIEVALEDRVLFITKMVVNTKVCYIAAINRGPLFKDFESLNDMRKFNTHYQVYGKMERGTEKETLLRLMERTMTVSGKWTCAMDKAPSYTVIVAHSLEYP
jgi:hypothetical protein